MPKVSWAAPEVEFALELAVPTLLTVTLRVPPEAALTLVVNVELSDAMELALDCAAEILLEDTCAEKATVARRLLEELREQPL